MFERITIVETENIDPNKPLDIGLIIESMLFYQKTIVVFSTEKAIFQLFHELGLENISKLIEADTLEIMFNESYAVIKSDTDSDKKTYHNIGTFSNNIITKESEIHKACVKYTGREGRGRRVAQALIDQTKSFKHMENFKNIAKEVFLDKQYIHKSYQRILNTYIPNQKIWANTFFEIENQNNGLYLNTNLDFKKINEEIATIGKEKIILGPADILASILEIENDVYKTSTNISDLVSQNTKNNLLTLRLEYLMEKINSSNNEKDNLLKHINKNFKTVRQEYYAGKIDINQIVKAILHSNKFKKWLNSKDSEENILNAYLSEISQIDTLSSLPIKVFRWIFFGITGFTLENTLPKGIGSSLAFATGILDTFFLEKMVSGWKPNQFINNYLANSIKK